MEITLLVVKMILSCYQFIGNNTNISKIEAIQFKLSYVTVDDLYIFPSPPPPPPPPKKYNKRGLGGGGGKH